MLLFYSWRDTALLADGDLVLASDLWVVAVLDLANWEPFPKLALLEVSNCILATWDVFGEEVVEVVGNERVVDTTSVAEGRENDQSGQESPETAGALWLWERRWRRYACGASTKWWNTALNIFWCWRCPWNVCFCDRLWCWSVDLRWLWNSVAGWLRALGARKNSLVGLSEVREGPLFSSLADW